jgi:hypothetical protein
LALRDAKTDQGNKVQEDKLSIHYSEVAIKKMAAPAPDVAQPRLSNRAERTFGLHPALFAATIGAYLAFLAIMAATFMNPNLLIPFAIFVAYIVMAFGVPALWSNVVGRPVGRFQSWAEFRSEGMDIHTGHVTSGAAIAQVLVLPGLIVAWGLAIAVIVALV